MKNLIELNKVNVHYGEHHILKDITLNIPDIPNKGEFISILGPSGCGKSTILKLIAGLTIPNSGTVKVLDKKVTGPGDVSMVFQAYSSFPWLSVLDNVTFGLKLAGVPTKMREERGMDMLKVVGLAHVRDNYPASLSGGMKQRVAIARSLITNPEFLLMDEPFGALDIKTRLEMQLLVRKIWEEIHCTVIMVTHDIGEAVFLSDDIYLLSTRPAEIAAHFHIPWTVRDTNLKRAKHFNDMVFNVSTCFGQQIEL